MDKLLEMTATIETVEMGAQQIKIKAIPEGYEKPLTFSFWKQKKEGGETKAYTQFKDMPQEGVINFSYKENPGSYLDQKTGETKDVIYKNIMFFANNSPQQGLSSSSLPSSAVTNSQLMAGLVKINSKLDKILALYETTPDRLEPIIPVINDKPDPEAVDTSDIPF